MLSTPPRDGPDGQLQLHASTVAVGGKAVALTGPSASGKSELALALMALGADLIADDITWLRPSEAGLMASVPPALKGQIEARHVGILKAIPADPAPLALIVDMGQVETARLPDLRKIDLMGHLVPLLHKVETVHFAAIILHYLKSGRQV